MERSCKSDLIVPSVGIFVPCKRNCHKSPVSVLNVSTFVPCKRASVESHGSVLPLCVGHGAFVPDANELQSQLSVLNEHL
eukprot:822296-Rhodomonas_salina.1